MNRDIMNKLFPEEMQAVDRKVCPFCKVPIKEEDFRDALSLKEYGISGLCQACQDETFG